MLYALAAAAIVVALIGGYVAGWLRRGQVADICPDCGLHRGEVCAACEEIWQATEPVGELAVTR